MSDTINGEAVQQAAQQSTGNALLSLALLVLLLSVAVRWGDSAWRAQSDRQVLANAIAEQEVALEKSRTVRRQLNALASKTVQLARQGNENATAVVDKMLAAGVTLTPASPAGQEQ